MSAPQTPTPPTPKSGENAGGMSELLNSLVVATRDHERYGDSETLKRCLAAREAVDAAYAQCQRDAAAARAERDAELAKERRLWSEHNVRIVEATGIDVPVCGITPVEAVEQLKRERGELRQRVEQAEKATRVTIDECRRQGVSLGRSLANYAATMERERAERAEADAAAAQLQAQQWHEAFDRCNDDCAQLRRDAEAASKKHAETMRYHEERGRDLKRMLDAAEDKAAAATSELDAVADRIRDALIQRLALDPNECDAESSDPVDCIVSGVEADRARMAAVVDAAMLWADARMVMSQLRRGERRQRNGEYRERARFLAKTVRAARTAATVVAPAMEECLDCDGCGWYEGGATIQTTCTKCGGTGEITRTAAPSAGGTDG